jgi:hypothetical protein
MQCGWNITSGCAVGWRCCCVQVRTLHVFQSSTREPQIGEVMTGSDFQIGRRLQYQARACTVQLSLVMVHAPLAAHLRQHPPIIHRIPPPHSILACFDSIVCEVLQFPAQVLPIPKAWLLRIIAPLAVRTLICLAITVEVIENRVPHPVRDFGRSIGAAMRRICSSDTSQTHSTLA